VRVPAQAPTPCPVTPLRQRIAARAVLYALIGMSCLVAGLLLLGVPRWMAPGAGGFMAAVVTGPLWARRVLRRWTTTRRQAEPTPREPDVRECDRLRAQVSEWSEISYEMWAVLCSSVPFDVRFTDEWNAARDRLRDRFHAALAELPNQSGAADDPAGDAQVP
jgi:hypothetical protein